MTIPFWAKKCYNRKKRLTKKEGNFLMIELLTKLYSPLKKLMFSYANSDLLPDTYFDEIQNTKLSAAEKVCPDGATCSDSP